LPVVRDPVGYPYLPGSEVKGALKTLLGRGARALSYGKVDCERGGAGVCCLFGGEVGEGPRGAGALVVSDFYPLLLPVPSAEVGVAYLTTPYLLSRAAAYLEAAGYSSDAGGLLELARAAGDGAVATFLGGGEGVVHVGGERLPARGGAGLDAGVLDRLAWSQKPLNPLYEAVRPSGALVVAPERLGPTLVSHSLQRLTRVRLDRETKTVQRGALWTEEYIPWGTLLVGLVADSGFRNEYCKKAGRAGEDPLGELLGKLGGDSYLVVGGKETVGGGLLRLVLWEPQGSSRGGEA
jgi:CRISPR-associated protein Cmr4